MNYENYYKRMVSPQRSIDADDFGTAWWSLLGKIVSFGDPVSPRDMGTRELLGVRLCVEDLTRNIVVHPDRQANYRFMVAEWLWIAAGRDDVATISRFNKKVAEMSSDDGVTFRGAYGPRINPQYEYLFSCLRQKPDTRQAVASIWTPSPTPSRDIPCTLTWQLLLREGKLHGIVTMRSSDIWLGLTYDFFNFSMLTLGIAGELEVEPGSLTFNLGSSHLYDRDLDKARRVLDDPDSLKTFRSPRLPGRPPANVILDDVMGLSHLGSLPDPWYQYLTALRCEKSVDALSVLYDLGGNHATKP